MATEARILLTAYDRTKAAFASAQRGLADLRSAAGKLNGALAGIGLGALTGALTGAGLVVLVKGSIDAADNMRDLAIATGSSVQALASYELAAKQSGTDIEALAKAMGKLTLFMANNADEAKRLGLTAQDPAQAMVHLAAALERAETPAQRNALAAKVLGNSWADLMPLLAQGSAEISRQREAAGPYAQSMARLAEEADKFNDSVGAIKRSASGISIAVSNGILPALNQWIGATQDLIRENGTLLGLMAAIGAAAIPGLEASDLSNKARAKNRVDGLLAERKIQKQLIADMESKKASGLGFLFYSDDRIAAARARIADINKDLKQFTDVLERERKVEAGKIAAEANQMAATTHNQPDSRNGKPAHAAKSELDVLDPFGPERRAAEKARLDDIQRFVDEQQAAVNDLNSAMAQDGARAADEYASKLAALVADTTVAKTERLQENINLLNQAFFAGDIGAQQYDQALAQLTTSTEKLAEQAEQTNDIAKELGLTFSSAFEDAVVGGKAFGEVLRGLYQDILRLTVRKTVTEPLAAGFSSLLKGVNFGSLIPGFAVGTDFVPRDMLAVVHRGEAIVPAAENRRGTGDMTINMTVVTQDAASFRRAAGQVQADLAFAVQGARRFM